MIISDEDRAALIAATRAATIAECQRALRGSADSLVAFYTAQGKSPSDIARRVAEGYHNSAQLLEVLKPPAVQDGRERVS